MTYFEGPCPCWTCWPCRFEKQQPTCVVQIVSATFVCLAIKIQVCPHPHPCSSLPILNQRKETLSRHCLERISRPGRHDVQPLLVPLPVHRGIGPGSTYWEHSREPDRGSGRGTPGIRAGAAVDITLAGDNPPLLVGG